MNRLNNVKITEKYKIWFGISLAIMVLGLVMAFVSGINTGIDFTGGTMMHFDIGKEISVEEAKEITSQFNIDADIIHVGDEKHEIMIKTKQDLSNDKRREIFNAFKERYSLTDDSYLQTQQFGPSIGNEIKKKALISVLIASIGMLVYITYRFELTFGVAAIIALFHDVLIVLSVYSIFNVPINSSFIAAILIIVGYSINDTIVIFDRLRENYKYMKKETFFELSDNSIKQTLTRSINTSLTTLFVIGCLYIFGNDSIKEFALPLVAGIIAGAYSSIFIASPVWALWKTRSQRA